MFLPRTFTAICCVCCTFAKYTQSFSPRNEQFLWRHAVRSLRNLREGRYHTMITCSVLHFHPVHLLANICTLHSLGPIIVTVLGPGGFLWLWIGSSFMASAATLLWDLCLERSSPAIFRLVKIGPWWLRQALVQQRHSFGASGSASGLIMAFCCMMPNSTVFCPMPLPAWQAAILYPIGSVFCLLSDVLPWIGHAGHLGGMAFGALYYYTFGKRKLRRFVNLG